MRYSIAPKDWTFVKNYEFLYFAKNICKNIGENTSKNLSDEYSQAPVDHAK